MKKTIINTIIIFILSTIAHTLYNIIPNPVTQVLFPVNESIWEHFKMLFTANIIFSIIKKEMPLKALIRAVLTTSLLALIYLPVHTLIGEILPITLVIMTISIFLIDLLLSKIKLPDKKYLNIIATLIIIIIYVIFNYLTKNPPKEYLFLDQQSNTYGIPNK